MIYIRVLKVGVRPPDVLTLAPSPSLPQLDYADQYLSAMAQPGES